MAHGNFSTAVVVDIILDENHPYMGKNQNDPNTYSSPTIKYQQVPVNYNTNVPSPSDVDYSYIGRATHFIRCFYLSSLLHPSIVYVLLQKLMFVIHQVYFQSLQPFFVQLLLF